MNQAVAHFREDKSFDLIPGFFNPQLYTMEKAGPYKTASIAALTC